MRFESPGESGLARWPADLPPAPFSDGRAVAPRVDSAPALYDTLERLVLLIEHQLPAMRASILLLDDDGMTLRHGAAPNLPVEYCRFIDGSRIGPAVGSCGTAAYRREQVIVRDIATDPLWVDFRDVALGAGLRACWSAPIFDAAGAVLGTFAMYYDEPLVPTDDEQSLIATATLLASNIIVRARAEAELRAREEELRERIAAAEASARALAESEARMRAARAEADRANKAKSDFLAIMSHELRTPLNAIGGYTTLMLDGIPAPASEVHQDFLNRILKAQQHLLGLIEAVLTHAKLEAGRMRYQLTAIRVGDLLDSIETLVAPEMATRQLTYDTSRADPSLVVRGDREKTVQILLNLLSNALKFTPPGGRISVRTAQQSGRTVIAVRDTGIGMTQEQVAMVFEPFVQFDNSLTRTEKGTGLGMPISRELARGMAGDLTVESEAGKGTECVLTLPADLVVSGRAD
jgi:signal transduction histidine kinase